MRNYIDKLKRYFWFSQEEHLHFWIVVVGLALIFSWNNWGGTTFDATTGVMNFGIALIFLTLTVFAHHAGQRMMALALNFKAEQRIWWYGLIGGLMLAVISGGKIQFLAATGTLAYILPAHRLGAFRYGPNIGSISKIVLMGPLFNIFFAGLVKSLQWLGLLGGYADALFTLNLWFAAVNLFPIPPLDGAKVFFHSRLTYVFIAVTILSYVFFINAFNLYSYIFALLTGCVGWLLFYIFFERNW